MRSLEDTEPLLVMNGLIRGKKVLLFAPTAVDAWRWSLIALLLTLVVLLRCFLQASMFYSQGSTYIPSTICFLLYYIY